MITIRRNPDGTWDADVPLPKPQRVVKKPIVTEARQMPEEFAMQTINGSAYGKAGDWLFFDAEGWPYPCDAGIFDKTYYLVDDAMVAEEP